MNTPGDSEVDLLALSRAALLDALQALDAHKDAVVVIGAQAIYLRTSNASVALAEATKDSDLALDPRVLADAPLVEEAMRKGGFLPDPYSGQPGAWINAANIPVDLMVPEQLADPGNLGTRGARLPPHDKRAMRRAKGLEATMVDNDVMEVGSFDITDKRPLSVRVAGPAALLIAKTHKIVERAEGPSGRLLDKDAHDVYRLLSGTRTDDLASKFHMLLHDTLCGKVASESLTHVGELFAVGPNSLGSTMAGRAEEGIGDPELVAQQVAILANDLLKALAQSP